MSRDAPGEGFWRFMPQIDYMWPHREVHAYTGSLFASSRPAPSAMLTTWMVHAAPGDPFPIPGGQGTIPLT